MVTCRGRIGLRLRAHQAVKSGEEAGGRAALGPQTHRQVGEKPPLGRVAQCQRRAKGRE